MYTNTTALQAVTVQIYTGVDKCRAQIFDSKHTNTTTLDIPIKELCDLNIFLDDISLT